jgi:hypothetical protein
METFRKDQKNYLGANPSVIEDSFISICQWCDDNFQVFSGSRQFASAGEMPAVQIISGRIR